MSSTILSIYCALPSCETDQLGKENVAQEAAVFGSVRVGHAEARAFPGRVADGHAERAEMLEECTQHVRTSARKQPDRCRVPAVIVRDDQVDRVDIVELVYLVLAVDYGYVPS